MAGVLPGANRVKALRKALLQGTYFVLKVLAGIAIAGMMFIVPQLSHECSDKPAAMSIAPTDEHGRLEYCLKTNLRAGSGMPESLAAEQCGQDKKALQAEMATRKQAIQGLQDTCRAQLINPTQLWRTLRNKFNWS